MIVNEIMIIGLCSTNKEYYRNIGYIFSELDDKIEIQSIHLKPNSTQKISIKCDECGKIVKKVMNNRTVQFNKHNKDLCLSCSKSGKRNPNYGKDRSEILKYARSFQTVNPMQGKKHKEETKIKMSISKTNLIAKGEFDIKSNNRGHKLKHFSTKSNEWFHADSALEKLRMEQLDRDDKVVYWTKRHGIKIQYRINGLVRIYVPDFYINYINNFNVIEEVKGMVTEIDLIKKLYAEQYCILNNLIYIFTTQQEMNKNGKYRKYLKELKNNEVI